MLIDPEQLGTPVLASDVCSLAGMRLYVPFLLDPDLCDFSFFSIKSRSGSIFFPTKT